MYGGVSNSQGAVAEEFYYNSLKDKPVLIGMNFDSIYKNIAGNRHGVEDEFDLVSVNRDNVFVLEIKYKAHPRDLARLLRKSEEFQYAASAVYGPLYPALGLGCLSSARRG